MFIYNRNMFRKMFIIMQDRDMYYESRYLVHKWHINLIISHKLLHSLSVLKQGKFNDKVMMTINEVTLHTYTSTLHRNNIEIFC